MQNKKKIIIAVGGTAGHIHPAQKIATTLINKDILFVGKGLSSNLFFQKKKFNFLDIESSTINKKNLIFAPFKILKGICKAFKILKQFKPDIIIGFGSYHSFTILFVAKLKKIKIILFESNLIMGKTNKFFAKNASLILSLFPLDKYKDKIKLINRWEGPSNGKDKKQNKLTILVFGGSQGADYINNAFLHISERLQKIEKIDFKVIHIIGHGAEKKIDFFKSHYSKLRINAVVKKYEENMGRLFINSDFVICRGGAYTISELIYFNKPSIIIPYPYSKNDHQIINATFLENKVEGALISYQKNGCIDLYKKVCTMIKEEIRKTMIDNLIKYKKALNYNDGFMQINEYIDTIC